MPAGFFRAFTLGGLLLAAVPAPYQAARAQTAPHQIAGAQTAPAVAGELHLLPTVVGARLRLALSQPLAAPPATFVLAEPMRVVVDLKGASSLRRDIAGAGPVRGARVSQFDADTVRIVVDLDTPMRLAEAVQDSNQVLELRLAPVTAAQFAAEARRGRTALGNLPQEAPLAVPPGPKPAPDLQADSNRRLDQVERALAAAENSLKPPVTSPPVIVPAAPPVVPPAAKPPPPGIVSAVPPPVIASAVPPPVIVSTAPPPVAAPAKSPAPAAKPPTPSAPATKLATPARPPRRNQQLVVIDAGHGGHDPGAPAVSGGHEKEVTLAIARAIRDAVHQKARARNLPIEVKLTRDSDYFIPLGGRVNLARRWGADLFLSVHANSAPNPDARGASVYTLSDVASDKEAARLAAKENRADLIAGVDLSGERREVASILIDLGLRDSMNASSDFAATLQRAMEPQGVKFRSQFHRFAGFQVLRNLGVPAALLETGFVSNSDDADYLFSRKGQQQIADGVADAIVDYLGGR